MDLFTHIVIAYLAGWAFVWGVTGYNEYLLLLCVIMAVVPDLDVMLYAIPARFRRGRALSHRGASHSVLFLLVAGPLAGYTAHHLWGVPLLPAAALALLGGSTHLLADGLTDWAFPLLAPFTWKEYSLPIDSPVTVYMIPFSLAGIAGMWYLRQAALPLEFLLALLAALAACLFAHYCARLAVRHHLGRRYARRGESVRVHPTPSLLRAYVVSGRPVGGVSLLSYERVDLLGRAPPVERFYEVTSLRPPPLAPGSREEAVVASASALEGNGFDPENIGDIAAVVVGEKPGAWDLFWFDWNNWRPGRPTPGLRVRVGAGGPVEVRPDSMRVAWF